MLEHKEPKHDIRIMRHTAKWTEDGLVPTHWAVIEDDGRCFVRSKVVEGYEATEALAGEWRRDIGMCK